MRVMNQTLHSLIGKCVVVYFNNILVYSKSKAEHIEHLRSVFVILRAECFYAAPNKCTFFISSVLFLGYNISACGISVDNNKINVSQNWPTPTSMTAAHNFHGLASFYHRFIPLFSSLMAPVIDCMHGKTFSWSPAAEAAFQLVKSKLTTAPLLDLPDFSLPFELHCDASKVGVGAILSQKGHPVTYFSEKLSGAHARYTTNDAEFYAIVHVV